MKEKLYWIYLTQIFGIANPHIWNLMQECDTAEEGYKRVVSGKFVLTSGEKQLLSKDYAKISEEIIESCKEKDIRIYTYNDIGYPSKLRTIYNPPSVIYVKGELEPDFDISISVVGTRHPSPYGEFASGKISGELASTGFVIVSGFAMGIDSAAHRGAVSVGGKTVAVLGCGVDIDYPKTNSDIRDAIMKNGAFISEFPPGTPPFGRNFPLRNRIISGLSSGVFIVEAPCSSGALITADMAIEQGRDVFCLPPQDIFSKSYQGVVKYLRDGALPVFSYLDILYEYYTTFSHKLSSLMPENEYNSGNSESSVFCEPVKQIKRLKNELTSQPVKISFDGLTDKQLSIVKCLERGNICAEEICEITELDIRDVLEELTELEMLGITVSLPGKMYKICGC